MARLQNGYVICIPCKIRKHKEKWDKSKKGK